MDGHTGAIGPGKSMKQSSRWRVSQGWGIALLLACMGMFQPALAAKPSPDGVWDEVAEAGIARSTAARQVVPHRYRTLRLSRNAFDQRVMGAPMERDVAVIRSQTTLSLPMPDGSYADFRIAESPVMAPALAKKYPQIRTWVAQGVDDPAVDPREVVLPDRLGDLQRVRKVDEIANPEAERVGCLAGAGEPAGGGIQSGCGSGRLRRCARPRVGPPR